ncbi:MAG: T9SS type A sorting domain-containing protein [Paludibacteraceae bacterium]|nr:T9SS type A sorting domain-containing protein [Paludibacteraceae bacterium]
MKKCLHFVVILVLSLFVTSVSAQNLGYVLEEDFEKGIPTTWTQEKVFGDFSWTVESGSLKYPNGTAKGTKRVAFRNETRQTTGAITRLISPVMDLSEVFQPILCFAHAQDKWTGDFDTLRVYYRTSESGRWIELKKFDQHIARWQRDTIYLTSVTKTYQIAFEATDNLGHGIVLDDVVVRSAPNCAQPFNLMITNVKNQGATLSWIASFDASELYLKVSTTPLTAAQLNDKSFKADAINATIDGAEIEYQMKGLVQGTKYYVYLQSNCDGELSEWSEVVEFTTTTSLELPYYQNFNLKYQPGVVSYLPYWVAVCGEFDGLTDYEPFINTFSAPADCYAFSPDATASLFFMGSRSTNSDIPAGKWNYIASPEVVVDNINKVQVSFWTTRYNSTQGSLVQQIIVGVMTDPSDKSTFVAVDTVVVSSYRVFEEFIVRLDSYKGEGKHIAFMSDFDVPNKFIMDDLRIEAIPTTDKAQIKATLPAASTIKVNFVDQSEKYEVVVLKEKVTKTDVLDTLSTVVKREVFTAAPCLVEGLDNLTLYYVYARHINGEEKGRWSNACQVRTHDLVKTLPYKMTFNIDVNNDSTFYHPDADKAYRISNDVLFKSNRLTPPYIDNNGDLFITANRVGDYNYVIFPQVEKKEGVRVELEARTEFLATGYFGIIEVGLATDAMDESTYQFERTIELVADVKKYKFDFESFKSEGNFLVIKVDDRGLKAFMENDVRISEVLFTDAPDCIEPAMFTTEEMSATSVKLTWDAGEVTSWNVRLSRSRVSESNLNNPDYANFDTAFVATTNSVVFENLEPGSVTYYYYVQPICGEAVGFWSVEGSFKTGCRLVESLPYVQNFDDAKYAVGNTVSPFGVPCMFSTLSEIETAGENGPMFIYYPYLTSDQSASANNSLYMAASADTADMYSAYASYVAFPKFNTESVSKLQITMKLRAASRGDKLEVGVMTDPNDIKTFELVEDITLPRINEWVDYYVTLDSYKGNGEYIALRMAKAASPMSMFVDNVRIENIIACNMPQNLASEAADVTAKLSWKGAQEKKWRLVVATANSLTAEGLDTVVVGSNNVVFAGDVTSNPYTLTDLATQTTYYWWIKSICNEQSSSDWSDVNTFTTLCELKTAGEMGVEDFEAWTYGKVGECFVSGNSVANASSSYKPGRPTGNASWPTTGKSMIQFYSTTTYNGAYLIFPPIDVDDISRLRVKFDAATGLSATGTNYSTPQYAQALSVGIITDVNDFSTYTEVATVNVAKELNAFSVNFDTYKGDADGIKGKRVVFMSKFDKDNRVYFDNVEFDTIPECVPPTVVVDSVTTSKIYLTLNGVGATTKVRYVVNGESDTIVTNNNKAVIENLKMAASCDIYASTLCEGEEYSAWSNVIRVSTGCEPTVAVPFSEDFDANPTAGAYYQPACWYTHYTVEGKGTQYPHVYASGYSGKGAYVYCNGDGQVSYLVSRELLVDSLNRCQVSFMAKGNGAGKAIIVGVVEDPSSPAQIMATFEPIDTIKPGNSAYEKVLILLSGYKGGAKYVAFKSDYLANGSSTGGVYIDNVSVELIPICAKPDVFSLISWKDTELTFSFKHDGAAKYEVEYGPKDFTQGTGTVVEYTNITNQFVLSGLTASTNYDIYMRAICSETDASIWSFVGNYTTTQTPINQFPYTNGFEDAKENALWQFVQSTQKNNHWYIDTAYVKDGEKALYVSNDGGVTATYEKGTSGSWAYRAIDLKEGSYVFSMDWVGEGTAGYDFMRIVLLPITATFSEAIVTFEDGTKVNGGSFTTQVLPAPGIDLTPYVSSKAQYNGATEWTSTEVAFIVTEEMAQYYNLAVYWRGSNYTSTDTKTPSMIVDNISIKKITCPTPFDVKAIDVSDSTAIITWDYLGDQPESYNVKVLNTNVSADQLNSVEETAMIYSGNNLTEARVSLSALAESTTYYVYVQSSCSAEEQSFWSDANAFTTACKPVAADENGRYIYNFDASAGKFESCFVAGNLVSGRTNKPTLQKDGTGTSAYAYHYAYSEIYTVKFSGAGTTSGAYLAFPPVQGDIRDMQVKFQMRPTYHDRSKFAINSSGLSASYARKIVVGTMGNPNEPSSFVAIDTVEYMHGDEIKGLIATNDPDSNLYWQEVKLPLAMAEGRYLVLVNDNFGTTSNQMYIDDVIIEPADKCVTPYGIFVSNLKSTSATINCNYDANALGCVVVYSTSEDMTENVVEKTVTEFPCTIEGLTPATRYYVRMQQLCRTEEGVEIVSDWSEKQNFVTAYQYRLNEEFETTRFVPEFWMRATSPDIATVFETQAPLNYLPDANSLVCWKTRTALHETGMFSTGHIQSSIKAAAFGTTDWLITPSIELEKDRKQHMLFDLALTDINSNYPFNPADGGSNGDDKFYVVVSEDNGATWTNVNTTLWENSLAADYVLNDIPYTGQRYRIDLSKYAGKVIKVAFYLESLELNYELDMHLDNVYINSYLDEEVPVALCQSEDFYYNDFFVASNDIKVGENEFTYPKYMKSVVDTMYVFNVNVTPMIETTLEGTICEGDVYALNGFKELTKAGVYKQKLLSANGCDSVITLNLAVTPIQTEVVFDTICFGSTYTWNGETYNRSGAYTQTLTSVVTGCDSVVTLMLKVNDALASTERVEICFGETYTFGGKVISESGEYTETFKTVDGCDSIVTLTAVVLPDYRQTYNEVICAGETFTGYGFNEVGRSGSYSLKLQSVGGCDSTITLNLTVLSGDTTRVEQTIKETDLPYEFQGKVYPVGTAVGVHVDTINVSTENCDNVIILTLTIEEVVGVDNIAIADLTMVPNPVRVAEELVVVGEFTELERQGLIVTVFNALGQKVYEAEPDIYPIVVDGLYQRGVYVVRVVTGLGEVYQGKVIVE